MATEERELVNSGRFEIVFNELADAILGQLSDRDVMRCCQINKHLNRLICESSALQFRIRCAFHQHVPRPSRGSSSSKADRLRDLLSFERNLHNLTPRSVMSIPSNGDTWTMPFQNRLFTGSSQGDMPTAWEMYDLESTLEEGPRKVISADQDARVLSRIMVPKRNLIVQVTKVPSTPPRRGKRFRIHFYLLDPSGSSSTSAGSPNPNPAKWKPVRHPKAGLPYIDIGPFFPEDTYSMPLVSCSLIDTIMFCVGGRDTPYAWVGVLDWSKGRFYGRLSSHRPPLQVDMVAEDLLITCTSNITLQTLQPGMDDDESTAQTVTLPCFIFWQIPEPSRAYMKQNKNRSVWDPSDIPECSWRLCFVLPTSGSEPRDEKWQYYLKPLEMKSMFNLSSTSSSSSRLPRKRQVQGIFSITLTGREWHTVDYVEDGTQEFFHTICIIDMNKMGTLLEYHHGRVVPYSAWRCCAMVWWCGFHD